MTPIIVTTPEQLQLLLAPYMEALAEKAMAAAQEKAAHSGRLLKYEQAREYLSMGSTLFSKAVTDGHIPYVLSGTRKLFRQSDLDKFSGYKPETEAERIFKNEIEQRQP